jgi:hypothetical protein
MVRLVLEPVLPVIIELILDEGARSRWLTMSDVVQQLVMPPIWFLGILVHNVAGDAFAHPHQGAVCLTGRVVARTAGVPVFMLMRFQALNWSWTPCNR